MQSNIYEMAEETIERFVRELCQVDLRSGDANNRINAACTAIHTALNILGLKNKQSITFSESIETVGITERNRKDIINKYAEIFKDLMVSVSTK